MGSYIVRRLWQGILVVLAVTTIVFVVTRLVGNPVDIMLPLSATTEQRAAFAHQIGLDRPILEQFGTFVWDAIHLDFGDSLWQRRAAMEVVLERLPNTLLLLVSGIGTAIVLSLPLGTIAALRPGGIVDRLIVGLGLLGLSLPQFWVGLMLIITFSVVFGLLPTSGIGTPAHIILPSIAMALPSLARLSMLVRSAMLDELNKQYIQTARAKGMPLHRIVTVHGFRNILAGFLTMSGWEVIYALAGFSVVVETVFAWPGLGQTALQAIQRSDLFLLQAIVFCVAILIVLINLALDIIYKLVDPRIDLN
ncbi:ABC transporter permease [Pelagibacterium lacus]|uniref:ABC transporter permease n=1 Tax=Pelagibacterium lacus TaxID=2282655 RepID=A0A369W842_9HYPH|nr:ABC transporter permease [Pelagibacterium lacus]RDE09530.1 ABC transporter permease [Pelagibacterium lacus]